LVHAFASVQDVGQLPSHVSSPSVIPLPHDAEQLLSFVELHPGAQQPSPFVHVVIDGYEQTTLHDPGEPVRTFVVQTLPSSHVAEQLPSHVSPPSTIPFPQTALQSLSVAEQLPPEGQQPSPSVHCVTGGCVHWTLQLSGDPVSRSNVQASLSLAQVTGQLPSHVSSPSTTPSPHVARHSVSSAGVHPTGQHPSPPAQPRGVEAHETAQAEPMRTSVVHESPSSQIDGHAPSSPSAIATSQSSPGSSTAFPHEAGTSGPVSSGSCPPALHALPDAAAIAASKRANAWVRIERAPRWRSPRGRPREATINTINVPETGKARFPIAGKRASPRSGRDQLSVICCAVKIR
jgi:hypothetical protein